MRCLPGQRYGRWTVIEEAKRRETHRYVLAKCDCGTKREVKCYSLTTGRSRSCGCLPHRGNATHGDSNSRLYRIWCHMLGRCRNRLDQDYHHYGARGIAVCKEWHSYTNFRDWALGHGYQSDLTIDRRDNDRGYSPANCRWVTQSEQCLNRRSFGNTSGYMGVYPNWKRWAAKVKVHGKQIHLGTYDDPFSAAWVRDEFAIGIDEYATTNNLTDRRKKRKRVMTERRGTYKRRQL